MKEYLIVSLLSLSSFLGLVAVLVSSPRKMIISWLAVGIIQSIFFISLGFELISLLNIIFVISSATVLKLFSSLYGSEKTSRSEKKTSVKNWIHGLGQAILLGAIFILALSEENSRELFLREINISAFAANVMQRFPELPWILGFILFLTLILSATIGRPSWIKREGASE